MIEPKNKKISISRQCQLLNIQRSVYYYKPVNIMEGKNLEDLKLILEVMNKIPFYGYRKISLQLKNDHPHLTRKRVRRLMRRFGLYAIYPKPNLSIARKEHKKYPYLLKNKDIRYPNQVWATDITYLKLDKGHVYLVAIIDLFSRKVLSWKLANTYDVCFCIDALEEAIAIYGIPAIFNTDQGSQFTSRQFTEILENHHVEISMDGKGRALDNIYVERLWRSLKYEDIYLKSYNSIKELKLGINRYFKFYNSERFHQSLEYLTPDQMHRSFVSEEINEQVA
jgi:putative transposase